MMKKKLSVPMTRSEWMLGYIYWALQLLILPSALYLVNDLLPRPLSEARLNFVFFCVNFMVLTVVMGRYLGRCGRIALKRPFYILQSAFLGYALYYLLTWAIGLFILWCAPDFANMNDLSIAALYQEEPLLMGIGTVILVPVAEELMYRGLIFRGLYNRSRAAAYIVSTLVFALVHMVGYLPLYDLRSFLLSLLQYLPAGLCLGWAYARSDTIFAPILIHMTVNQLGLISMR